MISWSQINDRRQAVRARWRRIWTLPVGGRAANVAAECIHDGARLLDIGASRGGFREKLRPGVQYHTLDVDPEVEADFRALADVEDASFDVVSCFETIEHLTVDDAMELVQGVARVLKPGGVTFFSTPNIHHPWFYLSSATHRTPFAYDELGGLLECAGLRVEALMRCHRDSLVKSVVRLCARPLYRLIGVDYAKSVLAVARRPAD